MGQIFIPAQASIILTSVDRLIASNADGGLSPLAAHIVLLGEAAGQNLGPLTDIYVIGEHSLSGGLVNVGQNGTVVYGGKNFTALTNANVTASRDGPNVAIGVNIAPAVIERATSLILIGGEIANDAPALQSAFDSSVVVGYQALERQRTLAANGGTYARASVILGYRALRGTAFATDGAGTSISESIFIGAQAGENAGFDNGAPGTALTTTIAIGVRALQNICNANARAVDSTTAIGADCAPQLSSGQRNVYVGASIVAGVIDQLDDVCIGAAAAITHAANAGQNIVLGAGAAIAGAGGRTISIGSGANATGEIAAGSDHLLVETVNLSTGVRRNLIYGNMGSLTGATVTSCGIVFGLSAAASRGLPGMNVVKIINGSRDAGLTAPVGGGYFYSSAGELHWVSTGNVDYALTPGAGAGIFTVATLPVAPPASTRAFVTDALAPAFGVAVAGTGAVFIPVFFDGATWIVG